MWLEDITPTRIEWLWKPFIQSGALNILTGDPGVGKSTLICDLVARLTRGEPLPEAGQGLGGLEGPTTCWVLNGEDGAADTISWRLLNQGADPKRVLITDSVEPITKQVAQEIGDTIARHKIGFVVIDPLQAWMGGDVDMNRANETREWANHLKRAAQRTGAAILFVRHRRKAGPGEHASLYSGLGSIDITGFARSEFTAIAGKEGLVYVQRIKGNVGAMGDALAYTIERHPDPENEHGVLRWIGAVDPMEAPQGAPKVSKIPKALGTAKRFLTSFLAEGPKPVLEVLDAAASLGISQKTLRRAKEGLAEAVQVSEGNWQWYLTPQAQEILQPERPAPYRRPSVRMISRPIPKSGPSELPN